MEKSSEKKRNQMMDDNGFKDCQKCVSLTGTEWKKERHRILRYAQNDNHAKMPLRQYYRNEQQGKISSNMNLSSLSTFKKWNLSRINTAIAAFNWYFEHLCDCFSVDGKYTYKLLWYD